MINLKKTLSKIITTLSYLKKPTVTIKSWSNIATPAAQWYTLTTFDLPAGGQYLILGKNGNGVAGQSINSISFNTASGQVASVTGNTGAAVGNAGNNVVGWQYVKTITDATIEVRAYGYSTTALMNGAAIAIPIGTAE